MTPLIAPAPAPLTLRSAVAQLRQGVAKRIGHAVARFANYDAASITPTTTIGGRIGSNQNSTFASLQRVAMNWTAEDVAKNSCIGQAYLMQRVNYCSSMLKYIPSTGDTALDADIATYLYGDDGHNGVFGNMGVACSMEDAFSRTADIETPVRGDAGLIWYDDGEQLRLMEFSADQLGEVYNFSPPRACALGRNGNGEIVEVAGNDCVYFAGRYFRGCDCVAYKIFERTNSFYGVGRIYQAADVIYFNDPASFRGVRGVTKFATAIQHMEKGERLFQTGMDAALRQAKTAMIVKNGRGQADELAYTADTDSQGAVTYRERLPGGPLVEYFYTGDDASFTSPDSPGPELIQGVETSDERVALALGINYAWLISATKVGGAPSRLEVNKAAKEMSRIQNRIHRPRLARIARTVIMDAVRRGKLPAKQHVARGKWMLPISPTVDAFYDAKENIAMSRAGFEAPQDIIAETNRDPDDVLRKSRQWSVKVAMSVEDANRELTRLGYKPTVTAADIAQTSDNPQQAATAEQIAQGQQPATAEQPPEKSGTAKMSDVSGEKRADDGKWTAGGPGNPAKYDPLADKSGSKVIDDDRPDYLDRFEALDDTFDDHTPAERAEHGNLLDRINTEHGSYGRLLEKLAPDAHTMDLRKAMREAFERTHPHAKLEKTDAAK